MMTTLLITLALLLPIPIALGVRPPHPNDADPAHARALRARLIWIASALAAITLGHRAFLDWIAADTTGSPAQEWLPGILGIWIPWMLLVRYFALLRDGTDATGQTVAQRYAALRPSEVHRAIRIAWLIVALSWMGGALIIGRAAWQGASWIAALLLLLTPMWLAFGYWLAQSGMIRDPEPFPDHHHNPHLIRAYEQRRSITAWSIFAIFSVSGVFHSLLAAATIWQSSAAMAGSIAAVVLILAVVAATHWRLRMQVDARIAALLRGPART